MTTTTNARDQLAELTESVKDFRAREGARIDELQASVDDANGRLAALQFNGFGGAGEHVERPDDPEYSKAFASWVRSGRGEHEVQDLHASGDRAKIHASMNVGTPSEGGYLAPTEWDRTINKALLPVSPMRRLATVRPTGVGAYSTVWNHRGTSSGWVGETTARTATDGPTFSSIVFEAGEIYANPPVTQRILDDGQVDVAAFIAGEIAEEFALQESEAFLTGDGSNKPRGLLTYVDGGASDDEHPGGNLTVVPSGSATEIGTGDGLIDFVYGLPSPYRRGASWLVNSATAAVLRKMKDSESRYLWTESFQAGQPATLLGYPVEIDEGMPDVEAGETPIAFGDFARGYLINDRAGIRVLRDPYTNKPYVHFYTTKRVGGGVADPNAVRLMSIEVDAT